MIYSDLDCSLSFGLILKYFYCTWINLVWHYNKLKVRTGHIFFCLFVNFSFWYIWWTTLKLQWSAALWIQMWVVWRYGCGWGSHLDPFLSCAGRGDGRGLQGLWLQLDAGLRPVRMPETVQHDCGFTSQDISRPGKRNPRCACGPLLFHLSVCAGGAVEVVSCCPRRWFLWFKCIMSHY